MKCAVKIYMVLGGFHVYTSVFLGWVVGRFNIAVNGEHNCGVLPISEDKKQSRGNYTHHRAYSKRPSVTFHTNTSSVRISIHVVKPAKHILSYAIKYRK